MKTVILVMIFGTIEALHCDKEYNLNESLYERGFDITCEGLTNNFTNLLQEFQVMNEISLRMQNCNLSAVSPKLFQKVRSIKHLHLENSVFSFSNSESVFRLLSNLEDLQVINTKFKITKNLFFNLMNLKKLYLVKNSLKTIEVGAFASLSNLTKLLISENFLTDLSQIPMCDLKSLTYLNLSKNDIEDLGQVFDCGTTNDTIFVNNLNYNVNTKTESFKLNIVSTKLVEIDLSYNKIEDLGSSFAYLKSLKVIRLQGNKLNRLNNSHFIYLENLESLIVDNNSITFVEDNVFSRKEYLETVDLSNNEIVFLNLKDMKSVKYLNLAKNKLNVDTLLSVNTSNNLKTINLDDNNISEISPNAFKKLVKLDSLHLCGNKIKLTQYSFVGLYNLKKLYLRNNSLQFLPRHAFDDLKSLTLLDLSQNNLTALSGNETFAYLKHLELLNLSRNSITNLNYTLVLHLKDLVELDLSYNKLHYIDYDNIMSSLPLLNILNIKFNALSCESLSKIIRYLQMKGVTYTLQEKIDLDRTNVGGIYCTDKQSSVPQEPVSQRNVIFNVTLGLVIILVIVILVIVIFKVHIFLKRRKYRADEFELIDE